MTLGKRLTVSLCFNPPSCKVGTIAPSASIGLSEGLHQLVHVKCFGQCPVRSKYSMRDSCRPHDHHRDHHHHRHYYSHLLKPTHGAWMENASGLRQGVSNCILMSHNCILNNKKERRENISVYHSRERILQLNIFIFKQMPTAVCVRTRARVCVCTHMHTRALSHNVFPAMGPGQKR